MTEWIDFTVYAILTFGLWFVLPVINKHFIVPVVADRNPDWLAANSGAVTNDNRRFLWLSYALGALSLAALVWAMLGARPERWMLLRDINTASAIAGLMYYFGCALLFERWLRREVPLATRRRATLERRSVDDLVPRGFRTTIYSIVLLHLAVWVGVGVTGRYSTPAFWGTLAFQFAVAGILFLIARVIVMRRPGAVDRIFGPGFRRSEARVALIAQLTPLMNGAARLYEELVGTVPADVNRALHLAIVMVIVLLFARYLLLSGGRSPSSPIATLGRRPMTGAQS